MVSSNTHMTAQTDNMSSIQNLIMSCLPAVTSIAARYRDTLRHSDVDDLVSVAMLHITERVSEALDKQSPIAWLISIARYRIQTYVMCEDDLIMHHTGVSRISLASLDAPIPQRQPSDETAESTLADQLVAPTPASIPERDYTPLYQALERISPKRRDVVVQHFGLLGNPETPIREMAPTRKEQQVIAKTITMAKQTLASLLSHSYAA